MLLIAWIVGFAMCVLALIMVPILHKKDGPKLAAVMLFILGLVTFLGSGFLHWSGTEKTIPEKKPVNDQTIDAPEVIDSDDQMGILLGNTYVNFELHPVMSGLGDNYLFDITVGETTKEVIENVSSDELTAFIEAIDFTGTNGNAVLMFEDGTGLTIMEAAKTYSADYGYVDVSEGEFTMVERLGAIWNDTGNGWYYMTVEEMQAADAAN